MRVDYALYALAGVFFISAAVLFFVLKGNEQMIFGITIAIIGILFIGGGYFAKPKAKLEPVSSPAVAPPQEIPPQQKPAVVEAPTPVAEKPKPGTPLAVEAPVTTVPAVEAPVGTQVKAIATEAPAAQAAIPVWGTELTKIRGINDKRAAEMKTFGINSVEDLAKASADDLAEKLKVSPKIVKMWIGSAKKIAK